MKYDHCINKKSPFTWPLWLCKRRLLQVISQRQIGICHMEDVNHKYPKTTIPNTMIAVVMNPATFFFLTNAIAVMIISSTYTIANQAVNPICNISANCNCQPTSGSSEHFVEFVAVVSFGNVFEFASEQITVLLEERNVPVTRIRHDH